MSIGRFCVQRLISYDPETTLKTWETTKYCSDDITTLYNFITDNGDRIWDTIANIEIKIKKL